MQAGTGTSDWAEIFIGHACAHGKLLAHALLLCGGTCKLWKLLVRQSLPLLRVLNFPGREACITGADVLAVLELARGQNLTSINLARCRKISATDIDAILSFIATACPSVALIDMEGCGQAAQLRALAASTSALCGAESPRALFEFITALQEGGGTRCPLEHLRALLSQGRPPFLVLDVEPGQHALHDAARMGGASAWVAIMLLCLSFPRIFDLNEGDREGDTPLLLACGSQDLDLAMLLKGLGADVNKANDQGDTPLLLACQAGSVELATVLMDAGADVNKANHKGETPLLSALTAGSLALARLVVSRGGNAEAVRQDGLGVVALALRTGMINFAMEHGPRRIATLADSTASTLVQAYLSLTTMREWLLARVAPRTLALEVGALMTLPGVDAGIKTRLDEVRAFLNHHEKLLKDPSAWPVAHCIEQLVLQWPGAALQADASAGSAGPGAEVRLLECRNPEHLRSSLRFSLSGSAAIKWVAFSPDGSKLARAEGSAVVVCCAVSYVELCRLVGHR